MPGNFSHHTFKSPNQSTLRYHTSSLNSPPLPPASPWLIPPDQTMDFQHQQHQQQQFEQKAHYMNAMKFDEPTPDYLISMVQSFSKGQNVSLTREQIAQIMQYYNMMGTHRPMTPEQHRMMAAAMQHQAIEHQHQKQQQQQQFEHMQTAHMNAMKFNKPTQDSLAQMVQSYGKGQNVTLTPEQISQVMQYCKMMGTPVCSNMMPGNQNVLPQGWMQQRGQQPEMIMNPVPHPNPDMQPPVDYLHSAHMQSKTPGQQQMISATMQHKAMNQQNQHQQQFEHQQIGHDMNAMKFNKPAPHQ